MKLNTFLILLMMVVKISTIHAQTRREGWHLSIAGGPIFGSVKTSSNGKNSSIVGTAAGLDAQAGAALRPNLLLHASVQFKTTIGPTINDKKLENSTLFTERSYGAGLTHYTACNLFFTANAGIGKFILIQKGQDLSLTGFRTNPGFSFGFKTGKEWKVSEKWALGLAAFWGQTSVRNNLIESGSEGDQVIKERWRSNRFGLCLQASFCSGK